MIWSVIEERSPSTMCCQSAQLVFGASHMVMESHAETTRTRETSISRATFEIVFRGVNPRERCWTSVSDACHVSAEQLHVTLLLVGHGVPDMHADLGCRRNAWDRSPGDRSRCCERIRE